MASSSSRACWKSVRVQTIQVPRRGSDRCFQHEGEAIQPAQISSACKDMSDGLWQIELRQQPAELSLAVHALVALKAGKSDSDMR